MSSLSVSTVRLKYTVVCCDSSTDREDVRLNMFETVIVQRHFRLRLIVSLTFISVVEFNKEKREVVKRK